MSTPRTDPLRVTLDHNCLIDVEERASPFLEPLTELIADAEAGRVVLSVPASAASERRRQGAEPITNFSEFKDWVHELGFAEIEFLAPLGYWGFSFFDFSLWAGDSDLALEETIHRVVAPNDPFRAPPAEQFEKWRNRKCDVQAIWCHVHYETDVLCTRDQLLIKRSQKLGIPNVRLSTPADLLGSL